MSPRTRARAQTTNGGRFELIAGDAEGRRAEFAAECQGALKIPWITVLGDARQRGVHATVEEHDQAGDFAGEELRVASLVRGEIGVAGDSAMPAAESCNGTKSRKSESNNVSYKDFSKLKARSRELKTSSSNFFNSGVINLSTFFRVCRRT